MGMTGEQAYVLAKKLIEAGGGGGGTVDAYTKTQTDNLLIQKVDKETGKGLFSGSYNDLSDAPTIPSKTSELQNDSKYQTESDVTTTLSDYATKTYVGEQIANAEHLKREIITVLPSDTEASDNIIYMLKVESATGNDKYQEYMKIDGTVQLVGDTSVDLTDYAKIADIPATLPANGGNADTVNNHTVKIDVPENAKFTDTVYDDSSLSSKVTQNTNDISVLKTADNVLSSRIDAFTSLTQGSTTGDAELIDIRVKADGTTATSAGNAVREQFNELNGNLGYIFENNSIPFGETITYSFDSLPVYKEGYYINGNGEVISDVHNKILRIPSNGIKKISITAAESQNVYTGDFVIALNKDGSFYESFLAGNRMVAGNTYSATLNRLAYDFTTILYINWLYYNDETYTFNDSIIIEYFTEDEYLKTLTAGKRDMFSSDVPLCALDFYKGGKYIDNYGEEQTHNTASIMRISADNVDKISVIMEEGHNIYPSDTTPLAVVKDKNGELTQILRCSSQGIFELTIDHDTCVNGTIYLNYYDSYGKKKQWNSEFGSDVYVPNFINITWAKTIKSQSFEFKNYLKRPFNFSGAVIEYIGDSITEGVINTNPIEYTTETYPKLFSNAVNALSYVNHGKAGACYISGLNSGVKTMLEQIQDITTTPDIIFVAGGTNDWLMGGNISDIRTALSDVCNYIKSNFPNSNVIFITPINESGWQGPTAANPTATLQTFRNAISEEIIKADIGKFSILQGNSFNFPTIESDSTYADSVIYDRLHPTELGYTNVYVTGLLNYLT